MSELANYQKYNDLLEAGDRTGAYIEYAQDLLHAGEVEGYHQIMMMAQVSSYSGHIGGAAILGNYNAYLNNENYNVGLDDFSVDVAERIFQAVEIDASDPNNGYTGFFNASEIRALAYQAWRDHAVEEHFPGNFQRQVDARENYEDVNFSPEVLGVIFDNDKKNYQGNETGYLDNLTSFPQIASLSESLGNFPREFGFTQEHYNAVLHKGQSVTLETGYSLSGHEVRDQNDNLIDYYMTIENEDGKTLYVNNHNAYNYYKSGGRWIDDPDTAYEIMASYWDNQVAGPIQVLVGEGWDNVTNGINDLSENISEYLTDRDLPPDFDIKEFQGDVIKNLMGADIGADGIRHYGTAIQDFRGFPDRPPIEETIKPATAASFEFDDRISLEQIHDIFLEDREIVLEELRTLNKEGVLSNDDEVLFKTLNNNLDVDLLQTLVNEGATTLPLLDHSMDTPRERVAAVADGAVHEFLDRGLTYNRVSDVHIENEASKESIVGLEIDVGVDPYP